jgi:tRNA-splicing ligase RtcB
MSTLAPHKIYAEFCDSLGMQQFYNMLKQPWVVKAALMPDAHGGYTIPIGSVVATKDVIVPSFAGYDLGCGMYAAKLNIIAENIAGFETKIFEEIYKVVPTGSGINTTKHYADLSHLAATPFALDLFKEEGVYMLGSLGSGNHFIEIGKDDDNCLWIIIHSGSRNFGHKIASKYMAIAANSDKPEEGMHTLDVNSQVGKEYILDLKFALAFALENRKAICHKVIKAMESVTGLNIISSLVINRNHNHAELNNEGLWVHRKGATHAELGMLGVVPGNMRDGSFIVKGKGNPESLCSSSHGAGRVMSRKDAKEAIDVSTFTKQMEGIVAKVGRSTLDESPAAYKDIFKVMEQQEDLVEIVAHVKPLINVKA